MSLSKVLSVVVGAGLSLSTAALLLILYIRRKEERELESQLFANFSATKTANQAVIRVKVPKNSLGAVIGRQGTNIKEIQEMTKTRINFPDKDTPEEECTAVIRGLLEDVHDAEMMIRKTIKEQLSIATHEMFIPSDACGRIIGRNGENIRYMCRMSKAKINVESKTRSENVTLQRVTIRGTPEQIEFVKALISEKLGEWEREQHRSPPTAQATGQDKKKMLSIGLPDDTQPYRQDILQTERLQSTCSDGFIEVFVSAVDTADRFWVQAIQGPRSAELDRLVEEMSNYYSHSANRDATVLTAVQVGDVVAAPFQHDQSWYRARVQSFEEECYSPEERKISLYYVDFGDSDQLPLKEVFSLDKSCLTLPFQAIECHLGNVSPVGGVWSGEATQAFENLTYAAQWKIMMLRVLNEGVSGDSTPEVELVDTNETQEVNIAEELVQRGHAIWSAGASSS